MRFELNIDYPAEKMKRSLQRMAARVDDQYVDRVPVLYCLVARYFAPLFKLRYIDFFKDVETHYHWQLQFAKYRIENIPEDCCQAPVIHVSPYFDNVIPPSGHGGDVGWPEDGPPRALPVIRTVEKMERFEVADPETGLRGKAIAWWREMKELAARTRVTFNGVEGRVEVGLGLGGLSPHMIAVDLVGEDFYWWMLEYPDACHRFLAKITQGEIACEEHVRQLVGSPLRGDAYGLAEDSAQIMSPDLFREFCVPYCHKLFDLFGRRERGIHMCGDSRHLIASLKEDMKMTRFELFGYLVPPAVAAAELRGIKLWGNLDPMMMKDAPPEQVKQAARECLEALAPGGGHLLGDGANVCPGTPPATFAAIMEASEEYGLGDGALPTVEAS
ncbi:hypothetical protein HQ576_15580 [bacterium]|nr:hypothetical protein [bacterium]